MKQNKFAFDRSRQAALKKQRRNQKLLQKRCPMISNLNRTLGKISASDAARTLIDEFNLANGHVRFPSGRETTISQIWELCKDHTIAASEVGPLFFWGGPPNNAARQFQGTLLTVLCDRILYIHFLQGGYADLISGHAS
jgi:hypothetical protein